MAAAAPFHVLGGAGALGLLWAYHLRAAGLPVVLLLRNAESVARFRQQGSRVRLQPLWQEGGDGSAGRGAWLESEPLDAEHHDAGTGHGGAPITNLIVATKAPAAVPALRGLLPRLAPAGSCRVVLLQNGVLAVADQLERELGEQLRPLIPQLMVGSVSHGCYKPSGGAQQAGGFDVVHAGLGQVLLGELGAALTGGSGSASAAAAAATAQEAGGAEAGSGAPAAAAAFSDTQRFMQELAATLPGLRIQALLHGAQAPGSSSSSSSSLRRQLLLKLAANCCINPLTALLRCPNGALAAQPHARQAISALCAELEAVFPELLLAQAAGAHEGAGAPNDTTPCTDTAAGVGVAAGVDGSSTFDAVLRVSEATARNRSSMLQDVMAGRPTEVDYLSGYVVDVARGRGVPVPANLMLYNLIKAHEGVGGLVRDAASCNM